MLTHLTISHYTIVEHLELDLRSGMSVITGETGAGKSIMLDALGLVLGGRAHSHAVKPEREKAEIQALFDLTQLPAAQQWLQERDLADDQQCILRRVITQEGRSRAYINGIACPLADLKTLGEMLVHIHGQHAQQALLKLDQHRLLLDDYAQADALAAQVKQAALSYRQLSQAKHSAEQAAAQHEAQLQLLRYQLEELDQLNLGETELAELEQEQRLLDNAIQLLGSSQTVLDICSDNPENSLLSSLNYCLQQLSNSQAAKQLNQFESARHLLSSAHIQIDEAMGELRRFSDSFDADPIRQEQIEQRLDSIYSLARKHKTQPEHLLNLQQELRAELNTLDQQAANLEQLEQQIEQAQSNYQVAAEALSQARHRAAPRFAQAVSKQLKQLGLVSIQFEIGLFPRAANEELSSHGLEQVSFLVSTNPGQPLQEMAKVVSGGELSRISLAIQVVSAASSETPTLVFDEVDVGIGGPTAEVVGRLLHQLGQRGQVIAVTHLPQVAAHGDQHLYVHKKHSKHSTDTSVKVLSTHERTEEVARMLGGIQITNESLAHAKQLLRLPISASA